MMIVHRHRLPFYRAAAVVGPRLALCRGAMMMTITQWLLCLDCGVVIILAVRNTTSSKDRNTIA